MEFSGKSVVLTGGTGGIGLAIARKVLSLGAKKVALLDVRYYEEMITILRETYPKQYILFHCTDVTKKDEIERAFKEVMYKFHAIDIIITSAGILDEIEYEDAVNVNFLGVLHANFAAINFMSTENGGDGGLVVNIASVAGIDCTQLSTPVYNATKHAVVAFTRSLGAEFYQERYGMKFITICPGVTFTQFLNNLDEKCHSIESYEASCEKLKNVRKQTVDEFASSFAKVVDIAENGSVWMIDGGEHKEIKYPNPWFDNGIKKQP